MTASVFRSLDNLAREHTEKAVKVIADIMDDPFAENRDRLKAANDILDRGHGKPLAATIALPANRAAAARLAQMSDDELMLAIQSTPLPRLMQSADQSTIIDNSPDPLLD
jgi:hypothetical protein